MSAPIPVLIPGSGLGPWIWEPLELAEFVAVDHPASVRDGGSVDDYAAAVVRQVDDAGADRVVLVGHSLGTVVAHAVAARLGDRVDGLLSVAGVVPADGRSFFSAFGMPQSVVTSLVVRVLGTRPPESMLRQGLTAGLDPAVADEVVRRFTPESQRVFRDALVRLDPAVRRGYVLTTHDVEVPPAAQRRFAARLGVDAPVELAAGHLPMLEAPDALRAAVSAFVAGGVSH